jgi:hypothetical protein
MSVYSALSPAHAPGEQHQLGISNRKPTALFTYKWLRAPETMNDEGLADDGAAKSWSFTQTSAKVR